MNLDKLFKRLDEANTEATYLSENTLSNVDTWYDTGCYTLNAIISGKIRGGGVPKGRIVGFSGPSMTGKTYIINKILGVAQKQDITPVIFDSEMAVDSNAAKGVGLDPEKTKYVPTYTIESCRNQIAGLLNDVIEQGQQGKIIISIDSLGNLVSEKESQDLEKGKSATDMGTRAKALKSMIRTLTYPASRAGVTILFSNHTYENPTEMYPSAVKNQSGGSGPIYLSSVLVQLAKKNTKQDEANVNDKMIPGAKNYSGAILRALTVKNRFIPPFLETEMYLNFVTGLDKYAGLLEMAIDHGVILSNGPTYTKPDGTKLGYYKGFKDDAKFWEEYVIPELEKKFAVAYRYGNTPVAVEE